MWVSVCVNFRWLWFPLTLVVVIRYPCKRRENSECVLISSRVSKWWVCLLCLWFIFSLFLYGASFLFSCVSLLFFHSITGRWVCVTSLMSCCRLSFLFADDAPFEFHLGIVTAEGFIPLLACVSVCACALDTHVNTNRRMSIKIVPCLFYCKSDQRSINIMCPALISTYSTATATTTTKVRSFLPFFLFRLSNSNSSAPQHISISMNFFWSKFGGIHSKYW